MSRRPSWHQIFMTQAYLISMRSPDTSTRVGAVVVSPENIVLSMGYNGWPRNVEPFRKDDLRWKRPTEAGYDPDRGSKYDWFAHAEENAIGNAARMGISLVGTSLYVNWLPCVNCARQIVQAGISQLFYHKEGMEVTKKNAGANFNWEQSNKVALEILREGGVAVGEWSGTVLTPMALFSGTLVDITEVSPNAIPYIDMVDKALQDHPGNQYLEEEREEYKTNPPDSVRWLFEDAKVVD